MTPDATATVDGSGAEVMASVDSTRDGARFIIADITREDAWIAVDESVAPSLPNWR